MERFSQNDIYSVLIQAPQTSAKTFFIAPEDPDVGGNKLYINFKGLT
jgi:hypothetical protein